jgi:hypothetical protein
MQILYLIEKSPPYLQTIPVYLGMILYKDSALATKRREKSNGKC